jgi:HAE1 family hydrophobic/amphiphilic exporter-1
MMTLLSTALGGVPLILSGGPGAEARQALGYVVVGGLTLSVLFTLFLTPVAFSLVARFSKPRAAEQQRLEGELAYATSLDQKSRKATASAMAGPVPSPQPARALGE